MKTALKVAFGLIVIGTALFFLGVWRGWFAGEPAWHGRTITQWLDRLVLYDMQTNIESVTVVDRAPELVATDPALQALLSIGSNAVPVLVEHIMERALWDPAISQIQRANSWMQWPWKAKTGSAQRPAPQGWSEFQRRRKSAAGYALIVLGTNANAGFGRFMEAYAAAPKHESIAHTRIPGPPVGVYPSQVTRIAKKTHPARRAEIAAEILHGLRHTNAWCRVVALECVREFPEELGTWKKELLALTNDQDPMVQMAALLQLFTILQNKEQLALLPASEIHHVASTIAKSTNSSERVQKLAEMVCDHAQRN